MKLLRCSKCGSTAKRTKDSPVGWTTVFYVECRRCKGRFISGVSRSHAGNEWNQAQKEGGRT